MLPGHFATTRGTHCGIQGVGRRVPLPEFGGDYANHTTVMPTIDAGSPLKIMITANCDQSLETPDQFELAARITYFPAGDPNGLSRLETVTFSSNPIPVQ
jgi:hypothetical protein